MNDENARGIYDVTHVYMNIYIHTYIHCTHADTPEYRDISNWSRCITACVTILILAPLLIEDNVAQEPREAAELDLGTHTVYREVKGFAFCLGFEDLFFLITFSFKRPPVGLESIPKHPNNLRGQLRQCG